jgi:hypothetical protein
MEAHPPMAQPTRQRAGVVAVPECAIGSVGGERRDKIAMDKGCRRALKWYSSTAKESGKVKTFLKRYGTIWRQNN